MKKKNLPPVTRHLIGMSGKIAIAILCIFASCSDEPDIAENVSDNLFQVEFKNGILKFSSADSYTSLIENEDQEVKDSFVEFLDAKKDYISLKKAYVAERSTGARQMSDAEAEIAEENDFLFSLLNEDGMITIGEHIFKVDLANEVVLVLPVEHEDQVDDLKNGNTENPDMMVFSTEDDVLPLLEEGVEGTTNGRSQLFCGESGADGKKVAAFEYDPANWGYDYRHDNKVVYQKAGVYFSLQAKIKTQKKLAGVWWAYKSSLGLDYYYMYEPKCRATREGGDVIYDTYTNELNKRPYESIRGLHRYIYRVRFYGLNFWSEVYEIKDGY